jgi:hypothetical protein
VRERAARVVQDVGGVDGVPDVDVVGDASAVLAEDVEVLARDQDAVEPEGESRGHRDTFSLRKERRGACSLRLEHAAGGLVWPRREARLPVDGVEVGRDVVAFRVAVLGDGELAVGVVEDAAVAPGFEGREVRRGRGAAEVEHRGARVVVDRVGDFGAQDVEERAAFGAAAGRDGAVDGEERALRVAREVPELLEAEARRCAALGLELRDEEQVVACVRTNVPSTSLQRDVVRGDASDFRVSISRASARSVPRKEPGS